MSVQFDYYYARESGQFTFYRIPKALFTDPTFHQLSVEAKLLYGLMLDRIGLSVRSGWVDEFGRVYIYFTHADVQEQLQCGHNKAVRLLKELDQGMGLIRRKRQGQGKPDRIYVMNFVSAMEVRISDYGNSEPEDFPENAEAENQDAPKGNSDGETSCFEISGPPDSGDLDRPKPDTNKNDTIKTDFSDTESIYPIGLEKRLQDAMDEIEEKEALLREQWGYQGAAGQLQAGGTGRADLPGGGCAAVQEAHHAHRRPGASHKAGPAADAFPGFYPHRLRAGVFPKDHDTHPQCPRLPADGPVQCSKYD